MLLFSVVGQLPAIDVEITPDELRWNLLQKRAQEWRVRRAFEIYREARIEPILIKGWAAGINYPDSLPRISIDMDLAVPSSDFEQAQAIARAVASEGLAIDLHRELRHLDTVDFADLFQNSIEVEADGYMVRILRPEDHLRVLCVHWLTDGGTNRNRLWDIFYLVEKNRSKFDWNRFLGVVSPIRRRWFVCTLGLAGKYLGLDLEGTPIAEESKDLPSWLTHSLERNWAAGSKHVPLEVALFSPSDLFKQLRRIIRPNPVASTIAMEGSFDARTRVHYQIANFGQRFVPALHRIRTGLRERRYDIES